MRLVVRQRRIAGSTADRADVLHVAKLAAMLIGVIRSSQPAVAEFVEEVKGRQPNGAGR